MSVTAQTDPNFVFQGIPEITEPLAGCCSCRASRGSARPTRAAGRDLEGPWLQRDLATPQALDGQDRFLELNLTTETLAFTKINGPIPNRGLLMHDINMFGLTYMQQIAETSTGAGLHIEPGIWAHVPPTSNPHEPATVVRMASIPHGTTILAQGTSKTPQRWAADIHDNNILPFRDRRPGAANSDFGSDRGHVHRAQPVGADDVPLQVTGRHPGDGQEPQQRPAARDRGQNITHTAALQ